MSEKCQHSLKDLSCAIFLPFCSSKESVPLCHSACRNIEDDCDLSLRCDIIPTAYRCITLYEYYNKNPGIISHYVAYSIFLAFWIIMLIYWFYNTFYRDSTAITYSAKYLAMIPILKIMIISFQFYFYTCFYENNCSQVAKSFEAAFLILVDWIISSQFYIIAKGLNLIYNSIAVHRNWDHLTYSLIVLLVDIICYPLLVVKNMTIMTIVKACFNIIFTCVLLVRMRYTVKQLVWHMNSFSDQFVDPLHTVLLTKYSLYRIFRILLVIYYALGSIGNVLAYGYLPAYNYLYYTVYIEVMDMIFIGSFLLLFRSRPESPSFSLYPINHELVDLPPLMMCNINSNRNNKKIHNKDIIMFTNPDNRHYLGLPPKVMEMEEKPIKLNDSLLLPIYDI